MTVIRTVFHDFEEGVIGAPFTAILDAYGGAEETYAGPSSQTPPTTTPQYSDTAFTGSRSLYFPPWLDGSDFYWSWYSPGGPIKGVEFTFKTGPSETADISLDGEIHVGPLTFRFSMDESGLTSFVSPTDYLGGTPLDASQWFTAKILPTGEWSFGYANGAVIHSGQGSPPAGAPSSEAQVSTYWAGGYDESVGSWKGAVSPLWIDNIVFWVDTPDVPPEEPPLPPILMGIDGAQVDIRRRFDPS